MKASFWGLLGVNYLDIFWKKVLKLYKFYYNYIGKFYCFKCINSGTQKETTFFKEDIFGNGNGNGNKKSFPLSLPGAQDEI